MTSHDFSIHADMGQTVGILAGWGNYPLRVAESLRDSGRRVAIAAINDHADPKLEDFADAMAWFGVARLGGHQRFFNRHGVKEVILAGKLFKDRILQHGHGWIGLLPDWTTMKAFYQIVVSRTKNQSDDSLLMAVVNSFESKGLTIVPGTDYAPSLLAEEGVLTKRKPTFGQIKDMEFGWTIAKQMGALDIGQSVTVKDSMVLAVEALEGTDACIERSAMLCPRGGFTLVKVAKPQQDFRFDLPTIGVTTIERMKQAGGKLIVIESNKTILVDRDEVILAADSAGISIVSRRGI